MSFYPTNNLRVYALVQEDIVVNTVIGDDDYALSIAEEYQEVIDITNKFRQPSIGWRLTPDGSLVAPPPFPSWIWDGHAWVAPVPPPSTEGVVWAWDEDTISWIEAPESFGLGD